MATILSVHLDTGGSATIETNLDPAVVETKVKASLAGLPERFRYEAQGDVIDLPRARVIGYSIHKP